MRIVTLLPSATEIVYALGLEPVGVSHECDYPPAAREKPAINRSRIDANASTREVNQQVVEAERAGGVYEIDVRALERVDPDLVVTQGICDVCAVDRVLVEDAIGAAGIDAEVLTTDPHSLDDVFEDVVRVGQATGRDERARELVDRLRERVARVRDRTAAVDDRPRTAVLDWTDPPMVAGHWVPGMVETAGGDYGLESPGERSRPREWAEIRDYDPGILVVAPCGFSIDRTRDNLADLTGRPGFSDLTAVRERRAYVVDGHHYLNRPGPRLVDSLEHLAGLIHPVRFERPPPDVARPLSTVRSTIRDDAD